MTDNNGLKAIYLPQLRAALRSHSSFRILGRDSGAFHWDFITAQIIPLPDPIFPNPEVSIIIHQGTQSRILRVKPELSIIIPDSILC